LFDLQSSSSALSGSVENPLIGKMLLLIAKKNRRFDDLSDNAVEVIRVTDEAGIVNQYHLTGNNYTPTKVGILNLAIVYLHLLLNAGFDQHVIYY
jgi:hypothetical protein